MVKMTFFYKQKVSAWDDEKVLEINTVNGCKLYLKPWNCTLNNVQNGNFYIVYIYHDNFIKKGMVNSPEKSTNRRVFLKSILYILRQRGYW